MPILLPGNLSAMVYYIVEETNMSNLGAILPQFLENYLTMIWHILLPKVTKTSVKHYKQIQYIYVLYKLVQCSDLNAAH